MSEGTVKAGEAYVVIGVDTKALEAGLNTVKAKLNGLASGIAKIGAGFAVAGAAITAPLVASVKTFVEFGDQLDKMSARTGVTVEALSEIGYAASLAGSSLGDVEAAVRRVQVTLTEAASGMQTAEDALAALGLSAESLSGMSPEKQFMAITAAIARIEDPTKRAAAAVDVFGGSGTMMLPMIQNLAEARKEAQALGVTMSTKSATAAAVLNDEFDRVSKVLRAVSVEIGVALTPVIMRFATMLKDSAKGIRDFVKENNDLVNTALKVGVVFLGISGALIVLAKSIGVISTITGAISSIVSAFTALATAAAGTSVATAAGATGLAAIGIAAKAALVALLPIIGTAAAVSAAILAVAYAEKKLYDFFGDQKALSQEAIDTHNLKRQHDALSDALMKTQREGGRGVNFSAASATKEVDQFVSALKKGGKTQSEVVAILTDDEKRLTAQLKQEWNTRSALPQAYFAGLQAEWAQTLAATQAALARESSAYQAAADARARAEARAAMEIIRTREQLIEALKKLDADFARSGEDRTRARAGAEQQTEMAGRIDRDPGGALASLEVEVIAVQRQYDLLREKAAAAIALASEFPGAASMTENAERQVAAADELLNRLTILEGFQEQAAAAQLQRIAQEQAARNASLNEADAIQARIKGLSEVNKFVDPAKANTQFDQMNKAAQDFVTQLQSDLAQLTKDFELGKIDPAQFEKALEMIKEDLSQAEATTGGRRVPGRNQIVGQFGAAGFNEKFAGITNATDKSILSENKSQTRLLTSIDHKIGAPATFA